MKYDQRFTDMSELTRYDIEKVGASVDEFQPVIAFTEPTNKGRIYIPMSIVKYYNPHVEVHKKNIRYLDRDYFEARIRDVADGLTLGEKPESKPKKKKIAEKTPAYGKFVWLAVPMEGGVAFHINRAEIPRMLMLLTLTDNDLMVADDVMVEDLKIYLAKVLGTTVPKLNTILRNLVADNLIYRNDAGEWLFTDDRIRRGDLMKYDIKDMAKKGFRPVRMYFPAISQMYKDAELNWSMKFILPMIPYLHPEYNVFCLNPNQTDPFLIAPLSGAQLCAAGGFKRSGYSELLGKYIGGTIHTSKGLEAVMIRLKEPFNGIPAKSILLNPRIFFAGNREQAEALEPLFLLKAKTHYRKKRKKKDDTI